jgi:uncharacterized membrane protein YhaH (DUF805 family)
MNEGSVHFLFRSDEGRIGAPVWRRNALYLAAITAVLTAGWRVAAPYTHHDLKTQAFFAPLTIAAYVYLLLYAFAVIFLAISFTNLSAKRLRDRGEPTGLGGLVPLLALFAGAAHWLQPQVSDVISIWYVVGLDALFIAAALWAIVDLGFREGAQPPRPAP